MARRMKQIAVISTVLCAVFILVNRLGNSSVWLSLAITFATISYHFIMRLVVGYLYDRVMQNKADYNRAWYQIHPFEKRLYQWIKVKKWKKNMPTYSPELFDYEEHTWSEIAQAMCQAELVHETIVILSFLPVLMSKWWDAFGVFLVTSIAAALFDLCFVFMQRYNRPRIVKLTERRG